MEAENLNEPKNPALKQGAVSGSGRIDYLPYFHHEEIKWEVVEMHIYIDWGGRAMDIVCQTQITDDNGKTTYPNRTFTIYGRRDKQHNNILNMEQKFCKWVMEMFKMFDTTEMV